MIEPEKRKAIFLLHQEGMGFRKIARQLKVNRKTVKKIIEQQGKAPDTVRSDRILINEELLRRLYNECEGWKQRIHEKLVEEEGVEIEYSTLTRKIRELGIGSPPDTRCDRVPDKPGEEMQHDTTVYTLTVGEKKRKVVCSCLYLRYSKRRYVKFYSRFNRFTMKCFLHEALMFWGYTAKYNIIDNTNLARLRGIGKNAVIVPEMEAFSKHYGFTFVCHERNHPNRKAGEERSFFTIETNFLPGRSFESFEDLNEQAFHWATVRLYHRPVSKSKLIPAKAFEFERPYLKQLPPYIPEPYRVHERMTDQYGYSSFNGNFYWVPGNSREAVRVLQYCDRLKIYRGRKFLAEYKLPPETIKNERFSPEGLPKPRFQPHNRKKPTKQEEKKLRGMAEAVNDYLDFALKEKGSTRHRFLRKLFALTQRMTASLFIKTIERALKYRVVSVDTIKRIALLYMNQEAGIFPYIEVDEGFRERDSYIEGRLTDEPDFSSYDKLLEEDEDE